MDAELMIADAFAKEMARYDKLQQQQAALGKMSHASVPSV
jgi:hypothetical protein